MPLSLTSYVYSKNLEASLYLAHPLTHFLGIYKRKQESKKKERKHALDQESDDR